VPAGSVHEELERVERARRRPTRDGGGLLLGGVGAHDDVALLERDAQGSELLVLELVLIRQRLDLLLLDEAALGGLLEQALGRRQVMQVNRVAQLNPFRFRWAGPLSVERPPGGRAARCSVSREAPVSLADL
jgi:hypothetical protein